MGDVEWFSLQVIVSSISWWSTIFWRCCFLANLGICDAVGAVALQPAKRCTPLGVIIDGKFLVYLRSFSPFWSL